MDVRDGADLGFGADPFDSEEIQSDPEELDELNGNEQQWQRGPGKRPLQWERRGGMVDGEHVASPC
jgi:hypothetical protein